MRLFAAENEQTTIFITQKIIAYTKDITPKKRK